MPIALETPRLALVHECLLYKDVLFKVFLNTVHAEEELSDSSILDRVWFEAILTLSHTKWKRRNGSDNKYVLLQCQSSILDRIRVVKEQGGLGNIAAHGEFSGFRGCTPTDVMCSQA